MITKRYKITLVRQVTQTVKWLSALVVVGKSKRPQMVCALRLLQFSLTSSWQRLNLSYTVVQNLPRRTQSEILIT